MDKGTTNIRNRNRNVKGEIDTFQFKMFLNVWDMAILHIAPQASISPIPNMKMSKTNKFKYIFLLQQEQKYLICLILNIFGVQEILAKKIHPKE